MYYIQNFKKGIKRRFESQKRKEKKWEEFKSTWMILNYIQNPKREFKEDLKTKKEKKRNEKNLNRILNVIKEKKEKEKKKRKRKEKRKI